MPHKSAISDPEKIIRVIRERKYYVPRRKPKVVKTWKDLTIGRVFHPSLLEIKESAHEN